MVKMFWLSETADYFETDYHWQQMLAIGNNSDMKKKVDKMEEKRQRNSYLSFRVT
jgi:hypothetical protein